MKLSLDRYVPPDFQRDFMAHIVLNRAKAEHPELKADPIFVVGGPAGSGKTTTTYALADAMGCKVYPVQGKDLVAQLEGQGSALLVKALQDASKDTDSLMPIVMVDDADLGGLGTNDNITGTVNGEAVKGCVMGWADNPRIVTLDNGDGPPRAVRLKRAPCMVMTTNRLDHLHPPMLRVGRSFVTTLNPTGADLKQVLAGIFPDLGLRRVGLLVRKFPDQSIAFFVSLKSAIAKRTAVECLEGYQGKMQDVNWKGFANHLARVGNGASYQMLVEEGNKIIGQARDANFINGGKSATTNPAHLTGKKGFQDYGNGALRLSDPALPQPHTPAIKVG